jgi:hypothetical protein
MSTATPEPKPLRNDAAIVKFDGGPKGDVTQTFRASRTDVLLVLKRAQITHWGWLVEFRGTAAELIAVGVASPDMFEHLGKCGQKTAWTPYGDQYTVKKRKAYFELSLSLWKEPRVGDPSDPRLQQSVWWREHGAEIDAEVANALARMRRPRKEVQP